MTKKYFGSQAQFSQNTINNRTFEKVYNCSNLGCLTYLFTLINGKVYGVAIFAEGPNKDKMVYENAAHYMLKSLQFEVLEINIITKDQAVSKVKALPEVIDYLKRVPNGLVLVNGEENNSYLVQALAHSSSVLASLVS